MKKGKLIETFGPQHHPIVEFALENLQAQRCAAHHDRVPKDVNSQLNERKQKGDKQAG
ncbi:unnamed protein product [Malus baccata var. baccata]